MKKTIESSIDLNDLNGELISAWISKLLSLQQQYGHSATISAVGDDIGYGGCTIEFTYARFETDEEYENRLESEAHFKQLQNDKELLVSAKDEEFLALLDIAIKGLSEITPLDKTLLDRIDALKQKADELRGETI